MRCPKCHYISFDSGERCRNCGYDFSLSVDTPEDALDLEFGPEVDAPAASSALPDLKSAPTPVGSGRQPADRTWRHEDLGTARDLPLFKPEGQDDGPLVAPPGVPRPPLAVRRATPTAPRVRVRRRTPPPEPAERALPLERETSVAAGSEAVGGPTQIRPGDGGSGGRRLAAAATDAVLLLALNLTVFYLTLRLAGLARDELALLPLVPFLGFLVLINGGYFVLFTATVGQTVGKMALGLRVVDASEGGGGLPRIGQAVLRALASMLSIAPLGLGYLPALVRRDGRALHDRLADTRVVSDRS